MILVDRLAMPPKDSMIGVVTPAVRLVAATLALVLALFPLAMERCRTACATAPEAPVSAASAHACHDTAATEGEAVATPMPRTCGHSDGAGIADIVALGASRTRIAVHAAPAVLPVPVLPVPFVTRDSSPPDAPSLIDHLVVPRNLPLRL
jgi:hypothetical protein